MRSRRWSTLVFIAFITLQIIVYANAINDNNRDENEDEEMISNRKAIDLIRSAINQMENNRKDNSDGQLTKRRCNFNLPGFDCDHRMMLNQANDANWWSGGMTPGKRRSCINADGSSCDTAQIAQELSNRRLWMNGPGRRKRRSAH